MDKELSALGLTKVSRKGIDPFYIVNMIQEQLFMGLLLDDKNVIHKPKPIPQRGGCRLKASLSNATCTGLPLLGLLKTP